MKALYRVVNALLAATIFPVALFLEFVIFRLSTSFVDAGLEETITIKQIIGFFTGSDRILGFKYENISTGGVFEFPAALNPVKAQLIAVVVSFAIALIAAIFIIVWSCCSNKRLPIVISSAVGIISVIVMNACFNSAAAPLIEGTINPVQIFSSGLLVSLLGNVVFVDKLCFAGFQNGMIIVFVLMLLWTAAFYIVEIGEPKEEKTTKKKTNK